MHPFFVLGNPRSGTSLFRLMLNSNPLITVPPECGFALWLRDNDYDKFKTSHACYDKFSRDVVKCKKFETWGVGYEDIMLVLEEIKPKSYQEMVSAVYMAYGRKASKSPEAIGDKNNYYIDKVEEINFTFPSSQKVFIVRDVRDVACSYRELKHKNIDSNYRPDLPDAVNEIASEWSNNARTLISECEKGACFIRYEDLLVNPREELTNVCKYLGVSYSDDMLRYNEYNDEPKEFMQWKEKTMSPLDSSGIGRYRLDLDQNSIDEIEKESRDELLELGYI